MDKIDVIGFLGWSAFLYGVTDLNGWWLIGCQAAWLTVAFLGRDVIDWYVARKA